MASRTGDIVAGVEKVTPEQIAKAREIIARPRTYEFEKSQFRIAAETGWPAALDECERLQKMYDDACATNDRASKTIGKYENSRIRHDVAEHENKKLRTENAALKKIADAAAEYHSHSFSGSGCNNDCILGVALKEWEVIRPRQDGRRYSDDGI